jgi:GH35 family endo-1,4-beta-xylanase
MSHRSLWWGLAAPVFGLVAARGDDPPNALVIPAGEAAVKTIGRAVPGGWNLWSDGYVGQTVRIRAQGRYRVVVRAWGSPAGGVWPRMALLVDGFEAGVRSVERKEPADYPFEVDLAGGSHEIAASFTNDALIGAEDRNLYVVSLAVIPPGGIAAPVPTDGSERLEEADRREQEIVAATAGEIERNRKADAVVRVLDASGRPVPGARVSVVQTGHEFLFGCNIYGFDHGTAAQNDAYKRRFAELFNYATVGFYWGSYEPERGKPNYAYTDEVVAWCLEHGIRMKGHPLLWGDQAGIPRWSDGQPAPEIQHQRIRDILARYRGKIGFYEVVNEPSHLALPRIDDPYRWAREADPSAYLIVNDYHVLADGAPGFFRLLSEARASGVPFDGIGIQAHEPRTARFPLDRVRTILDRYATLGKELHITEFTPTSSGQPITDSHLRGAWDEAAQADYAVKFYRVCFAHPAVRAITWWDLGDRQSWLPGGGLLRRDMTPKPAYEQLRRLIRDEWMTRQDGATDPAGQFAFRGFRGTYRVRVEAGGRSVERSLTLAKGDANTLSMSLP